jgi:hypothetical protein
MVHALEEVHRLLRPDGCLIDIRPTLEAPSVEVHQGSVVIFAEPLPDYGFEDILQADRALGQVINRRMLTLERRAAFDFLVYASSATELRTWLEAESAFEGAPDDAAPADWELALAARAEGARRAAGPGAEAVFREPSIAALLRPLHAAAGHKGRVS